MLTKPALAFAGLALGALAAHAEDAPITFRELRSDTVLAEDGKTVQTVHLVIAAGNDGAARGVAQQNAAYTEGLQRLELLDGATLKADGTRIPLAPGAVREQLAPGSPNLPQFSDLKRIVAVFPNVQAGDAVELTWRFTTLQPLFPGQFSQARAFSPNFPWQDVRMTVSAPLDRPLHTEEFGPTLQVSETGDTRTYTWTYSAPGRTDNHSVLAPLDRFPRLFVSTFPSWPALGDAWAALVEPKIAVTPAIQTLADTLTQGIDDPRAQTEAIYDWVSRHIRWVALYIGYDTWVPHAAADILANGYGDCKDQVVLLSALLRAKGITAEPVLINSFNSYKLSGPATTAFFNHAITYVPRFGLYLDTTAEGAPFGTVPFPLYGKPIVHVRLEGSELGQIPALPAGVAAARVETTATLGVDGVVTGTTLSEGTGPDATRLRVEAERLQVSGTKRGAETVLRTHGQAGTGDLELAPLDQVSPQYRVVGHFTLNPQPEWLTGEAFPIPSGLTMLARPGDGLLGPLGNRDLPAIEPTPCYAGEQREDLALTLPPGRHPDRLPRDRTIDNPDFTYTSRWSFQDGTIAVHRALTSRIASPLCEGPLREQAARALSVIRQDLQARISLED